MNIDWVSISEDFDMTSIRFLCKECGIEIIVGVNTVTKILEEGVMKL